MSQFTMKHQPLIRSILNQTSDVIRVPSLLSHELVPFYGELARELANQSFLAEDLLFKWFSLINNSNLTNDSKLILKESSMDAFLKKLVFPYSTHFWIELKRVYAEDMNKYLNYTGERVIPEEWLESVHVETVIDASSDVEVEISELEPVVDPLAHFDKMTIRQLQAYADEHFIDLQGERTKTKILEIIKQFTKEYNAG